jgi:hypothetical protein
VDPGILPVALLGQEATDRGGLLPVAGKVDVGVLAPQPLLKVRVPRTPALEGQRAEQPEGGMGGW